MQVNISYNHCHTKWRRKKKEGEREKKTVNLCTFFFFCIKLPTNFTTTNPHSHTPTNLTYNITTQIISNANNSSNSSSNNNNNKKKIILSQFLNSQQQLEIYAQIQHSRALSTCRNWHLTWGIFRFSIDTKRTKRRDCYHCAVGVWCLVLCDIVCDDIMMIIMMIWWRWLLSPFWNFYATTKKKQSL